MNRILAAEMINYKLLSKDVGTLAINTIKPHSTRSYQTYDNAWFSLIVQFPYYLSFLYSVSFNIINNIIKRNKINKIINH